VTAEAATRVWALARAVAARGNRNASSDAGTAEQLAVAAARSALLNVQVNLASLGEPPLGAAIEAQAQVVRQTLNAVVA
jgi:formiminotetrahydrofolate cyclodeaminase